MNGQNALCALWMLSRAPLWSRVHTRLLSRYGSPEEVYAAAVRKALDPTCFSAEEIARFCDPDLFAAKEQQTACRNRNINLIAYGDPDYPVFLREIADPPVLLFAKGTVPDTFGSPSITIVGTRNCSDIGKRLTARLAYDLSRFGFTVVSGMARGIDTYAHKGCLMANRSPTVAVLAGSVEDVYPAENRQLYELICQNGAVVSEVPPGSRIGKWASHQRNRVLSGLTFATVVVESGVRGGSMITAHHALEQNRTVFAVPGAPSAQKSEGTNLLIKSGAMLCSDLNDILNEYRLMFHETIDTVDVAAMRRRAANSRAARQKALQERLRLLDEDGKRIYEALAPDGQTADGLCEITALPLFEIISRLQDMEFKDLVEQIPGGIYIQKQI